MNKKIFTEIPFDIDLNELKETLRLRNNKRILEKTATLVEQAKKLAKPKAIYREAFIQDRNEENIAIDNVVFKSKTLQLHTKHVKCVFPYVITCGTEIEKLSDEEDDIMGKFILDGIKTIILMCTTNYISQHIKNNYDIENISYDIPGSLDEWDMKDQDKLFHLIGDITNLIGVRLSDSHIMHPGKSVSGIYYQSR